MLASKEYLKSYLEIMDNYNLELTRLNNTVGIYLKTRNPIIQEVGLAFLSTNLLNLLKHNLCNNLKSILFSLELNSTKTGYSGWEVLKILGEYPNKYFPECPINKTILKLNKIKENIVLSPIDFVPKNYRSLNFGLNFIREYKLSSKPIGTFFLPVSIHKALIYSVKKSSFIDLADSTKLVKDELEATTKTLITAYKYLVELMYEEWIGTAVNLISSIKTRIEEILSHQNKPIVNSFIEDIKQLEVNTTDSVEEYLYQLDRIDKVCSVTQTMLI